MAANRFTQGLEAPAAPKVSARAGIPGGSYDPGRVPGTSPHDSAAFQILSGTLSQISSQVNDLADKQAVKEGIAAGAKEGADPNWKPTNALTLRGEAYDRAGLETFRSKMTVKLQEQLDGVADKHKADPVGTEKALAGVQAGWNKHLIDEVRPEFEEQFARAKIGLVRSATNEQRQRVVASQRAAVEADVQTRLLRIQQQAYRLGTDPTADAALAAEMQGLQGRMAVTGVDGERLFSPDAAGEMTRRTMRSVAEARLKGAFTQLPDAGAREAFVKGLGDKYLGGGDALLNTFAPDDFERLQGGMVADVRAERAASGATDRALKQELEDFSSQAKDGYSLPEPQLQALRHRVASSGDSGLAARFDGAVNTLGLVQNAQRLRPAELEQSLSAMRAKAVTSGATPAEHERLELLEGLQTKMRTEIERDPLEWASRTGLVPVPALDGSSPQAVAASLKGRAAVAEQVAGYYGRPVTYFREAEKAQMAASLNQGGDQLVNTARVMVDALGSRAPKALAEISKDAPEAAVAGAVMISQGDPRFVSDMAEGLRLKREGGDQVLKGFLPTQGETTQTVRELFGRALAVSPETESAVLAAAGHAYAVRAARTGQADFQPELYQEALMQAVGQVAIGGRTFGGVATYNGRELLVPAQVEQGSFDDVVAEIRLEDITKLGPLPKAGGSTIRDDTLRRAKLLSVGDGRYLVALGDPDSEDPQFVDQEPGKHFVLDLNALTPALRQRRPDYFRGVP